MTGELDPRRMEIQVTEDLSEILARNEVYFGFTEMIDGLIQEQVGKPILVEDERYESYVGVIIHLEDDLQNAVLLKNGSALIIGPGESNPESIKKYKPRFLPSALPLLFSGEKFISDLDNISLAFEKGGGLDSKVIMRNDEENQLLVQKKIHDGIERARKLKKEAEEKARSVGSKGTNLEREKDVFSGSITIFDRTIDFGFRFKFGRKNK